MITGLFTSPVEKVRKCQSFFDWFQLFRVWVNFCRLRNHISLITFHCYCTILEKNFVTDFDDEYHNLSLLLLLLLLLQKLKKRLKGVRYFVHSHVISMTNTCWIFNLYLFDTHTHTHIYSHTDKRHTHTLKHVHPQTHRHTYTHEHKHIFTHRHIDTHTFKHTHVHLQTHRHTDTYEHKHTHTCSHTHMQTQTHRHSRTLTHTPHTHSNTHSFSLFSILHKHTLLLHSLSLFLTHKHSHSLCRTIVVTKGFIFFWEKSFKWILLFFSSPLISSLFISKSLFSWHGQEWN